MSKPQYVAVYGSLLSGLGNHRVMETARGELVSTGKVAGFDLWAYAGTAYPAVSENADAVPLSVEVYKVPGQGLEGPLDSLEGYPHFYDRKLVTVALDCDCEEAEAWIYYHRTPPAGVPLVESGCWKTYREAVS